MSFRRRLTFFFLVIVVLPMLAVAVFVVEVGSEAEVAKADARLAASLDTGLALYREELERSADAARGLSAPGSEIPTLLVAGEGGEIQRILDTQLEQRELYSIALANERQQTVAQAGGHHPAAVADVEMSTQEGPLATLSVAAAGAAQLAGRIEELTATTVIMPPVGEMPPAGLPDVGETGDVELEAGEMRAAVAAVPDDPRRVIAVAEPVGQAGALASRPLVALALAIFFSAAVGFVALILRALQGQVGAMLDAARRIGSGDFTSRVPVEGDDELAGLAREFNKMSERLGEQVEELKRQKAEVDRSVRRLGEAFAAGLDRDALLEIVVETTLGACSAELGSVRVAGAEPIRRTASGRSPSDGLAEAVRAAERRARDARQPVEARRGTAHALAAPLVPVGGDGAPFGTLAIGRSAEPFEDAERELFIYLLAQGAASIENAALHEKVSTEAVTDDLTGIANVRAFRETLAKEVARAQRFGHALSLLMLDIDDFKPVNDELGHLQGDAVLRRIGEVLASESREIDEPARYGGEEFVVALPETELEGALEVAERIRRRIESESVERIDGEGQLAVTASIGVATLTGRAADQKRLVAEADDALYRAKRSGKNRVERAA